jgi:hypothetical protein
MVVRRWRLILALVACALALWWGGAVAPGPLAAARPASSFADVVVMSPSSSSGPVNTLLNIEIRLYPADPVTYTLAVTTTPPDQNGCASAQPFSGASTVRVQGPQGGAASFQWPASLRHGRYWFCAAPSAGVGPTAMSPAQTPFTVLTDAAPAVTTALTPAGPGVYSGLTVSVTDWLTDEHAPPQLVLLPDDGTDVGMPIDATLDAVRSDPASGHYTFTMPMPHVTQSGRYAIAAQGDCRTHPCAVSEHSAYFEIGIAASYHYEGSSSPGQPTPTVTLTIHRDGQIGHPESPLLWGWVVAALLILVLLAVGLYAFRRMR